MDVYLAESAIVVHLYLCVKQNYYNLNWLLPRIARKRRLKYRIFIFLSVRVDVDRTIDQTPEYGTNKLYYFDDLSASMWYNNNVHRMQTIFMATPKKKWLTKKWPHIKMNIQNGSKRMDGVWASIIFCHLIVYLFCFIFFSLSVLSLTCVQPGTCFLFIELVLGIGHCWRVCVCASISIVPLLVGSGWWWLNSIFRLKRTSQLETTNAQR